MITGRFYIGSAVNIRLRLKAHRKALRGGRHHSVFLQRSWNKYGARAFAYEVIEYVADRSLLIEREQHWIDTMRPHFNMSPTAGSSLGYRHTAEALQKMSAAKRGRKWTPEQRASITKTLQSPEYRKRMSQTSAKSFLGKTHTAEVRRKISEAHAGKRLSEAHREKLSVAHRKQAISSTRLSPEQIQIIKNRLSKGERTVDLAREHGVHYLVVHRIKNRQTFSWL